MARWGIRLRLDYYQFDNEELIMKYLATSAAAALAVCIAAAPASAVEVVLENGGDGELSGEFGMTVSTAGAFTRLFTFFLPESGFTGATISTIGSARNNIDFTSVTLNGQAFSLSGPGVAEFGFIDALATMSGQQTLTVNGISGGNGSFAGTIAFQPGVMGAVPEPSTWAFMLLGFGAIGYGMRRRKQTAQVRYSFA